jgi:hypothetical protein
MCYCQCCNHNGVCYYADYGDDNITITTRAPDITRLIVSSSRVVVEISLHAVQ